MIVLFIWIKCLSLDSCFPLIIQIYYTSQLLVNFLLCLIVEGVKALNPSDFNCCGWSTEHTIPKDKMEWMKQQYEAEGDE